MQIFEAPILTLVTRSLTLDYSLFDAWGRQGLDQGTVTGIGCPSGTVNHREALKELLLCLPPDQATPALVVHYFLRGQAHFPSSILVTDVLMPVLNDCAGMAPLHNPAALEGLEVTRTLLPDAKHVAVFDNAFYQTLPPEERVYAIPKVLRDSGKMERYGSDGLYHLNACRLTLARMKDKTRPRILSLCIGSHLTLAGCHGLSPLVISGGFSPLEGIMGSTTCGELDPSICLALLSDAEYTVEELDQILTHESGIKGVTGETLMPDEIFLQRQSDDQQASTPSHPHAPPPMHRHTLAKQMLLYQIIRHVGAAIAVIGGLDALVFTGPRVSEAGAMIDEITKQLNQRLVSANHQAEELLLFRETADLHQIMAQEAIALLEEKQ